jgi:hypothetical protein
MNKRLFTELVESMAQMDEIVRGKRAPSRKTRAHRSLEGPPDRHQQRPKARTQGTRCVRPK